MNNQAFNFKADFIFYKALGWKLPFNITAIHEEIIQGRRDTLVKFVVNQRTPNDRAMRTCDRRRKHCQEKKTLSSAGECSAVLKWVQNLRLFGTWRVKSMDNRASIKIRYVNQLKLIWRLKCLANDLKVWVEMETMVWCCEWSGRKAYGWGVRMRTRPCAACACGVPGSGTWSWKHFVNVFWKHFFFFFFFMPGSGRWGPK